MASKTSRRSTAVTGFLGVWLGTTPSSVPVESPFKGTVETGARFISKKPVENRRFLFNLPSANEEYSGLVPSFLPSC